jgi:hypothetical protein
LKSGRGFSPRVGATTKSGGDPLKSGQLISDLIRDFHLTIDRVAFLKLSVEEFDAVINLFDNRWMRVARCDDIVSKRQFSIRNSGQTNRIGDGAAVLSFTILALNTYRATAMTAGMFNEHPSRTTL